MAKQTINIGSSANDGTGDPLRTAFDKINDNFTELYGSDDDATNFVLEDTSPQLGGDLDVNGQRITSARSNEDIIIAPAGTGGVVASAVRIAGTTLSSDDSSAMTIAEALQINGATNIDGALTATSTLAVTGAITGSSTVQGTTITATTAFVPDAADGAALGTTALEFSDLFLADGAVIGLGADQDVTLTHVADTGVLLNSANVIQFRDSGLTIGSNADGDLDIVSDGTAVDSINIESAGGITLDAGTAGSGIVYEDDGTEMMRIHNSSSDVIVESKVSDKDIIFKVNDGGASTEVFRVDGDVSALLVASGKELRFADSGEKIASDGTDLTVNAGADINLTATTDINVPANVGLTFGDDGEKIEGDGTNLTIASSGTATITATGDTAITNNATIGGTLGVTGAATFSGTAVVDNITINDSTISTSSNADLNLTPGGTGSIVAGAITIAGTRLTAADSTKITIGEALDVEGNLVSGNTNIGGTLSSTGAVSFASTFSVEGATTLTGALLVNNSITATNIIANDFVSNGSNADISIQPSGTGDVVLSALRINGTTLDSADSTKVTIDEAVDVTGALAVAGQTTLTGSFLPAIHTFTATDAITEIEHAGRTLLLGEVGGNALVTLTLPDATGSGATYKFIVSVANTSNYVIKVPDADNTIAGIMTYLDEDGTAVTAFPTVAASDTITLNGGTTGGIVGDYLEIIDIAADKYHVRGVMRVAAGANPATPFSATVS